MTRTHQSTTSPRRQYVATAIVAIIAMVSAMSVVSQQKSDTNDVTFQTMSVHEHNTSLEELAQKEYEKAGMVELPPIWEQ